MNFGDLAYPDVPTDAVHLLPLGATEPHGPHAPLVDRHADLGRDLPPRRRAARRRDPRARAAARCPTASRATAPTFPGAVSISEETLRSLVTDDRRDRRALVLVNSHFEPEQVRDCCARPGLPLFDLTRRARPSGSPRSSARARATRDATRPRSCSPTARSSFTPSACSTLPQKPIDMPAAIRAGQTSFVAMGMDQAYCRRAGRGDAPRRASRPSTMLDGHARRADPRGRGVITHADLPRELNLATWFVDRNVEEGRGDRVALISAAGRRPTRSSHGSSTAAETCSASSACAQRSACCSSLADSVDFVALWYGAQKIGAVTAEAYTFLQPKDYAYYLEYTDAAVVVADETTRGARSAGRRRSGRSSSSTRRVPGLATRSTLARRARAGADDEGRRRALEVHDRQHGTAEGRRPSRRTARCSATTGTRKACSVSARTTSCCRCRSSSSATRAT